MKNKLELDLGRMLQVNETYSPLPLSLEQRMIFEQGIAAESCLTISKPIPVLAPVTIIFFAAMFFK